MKYYFEADGFNSLETTPRIIEAAQLICAALFFNFVCEIADLSNMEPSNIAKDLITDSDGRSVKKGYVLYNLGSESEQADEFDIAINLSAFPDYSENIEYDELLDAYNGMYHGCYKFSSFNIGSYWSPGQVLDTYQYLQFMVNEFKHVNSKKIKDNITNITGFFELVSKEQKSVRIVEKEDYEV